MSVELSYVEFNLPAQEAASAHLRQLSEELRTKTPIAWFGYMRFTKTRDLTILSTLPRADRYYLAKGHHQLEFNHLSFESITNGVNYNKSICPSFAAAQVQAEYRKEFGLDNYLMIVEKDYAACHVYLFACPAEQGQMINYYLNNIGLLQAFVTENSERVKEIVSRVPIPSFHIPLEMKEEVRMAGVFNDSSQVDTNLFLNERQEAMVGLAHSDFSCLTERELQCLKYIVRGLTSKEIANKLNISFRTVENYSARIKYKLGCRRKHDILRKYGSVL